MPETTLAEQLDALDRAKVEALANERTAKRNLLAELDGARGEWARERREIIANRLTMLEEEIAVAKGRQAARAAMDKAAAEIAKLAGAEAELIEAEGKAHAHLHRQTTETGRAAALREIERIERLREDWRKALDAAREREQQAIDAYHGRDRKPDLPRTVADLVKGS